MLLAADVGGTHTRIGLAVPERERGFPVRLVAYRSYACADWPALADIFMDFLATYPEGRAATTCAMATAGYMHHGKLVAENLPWTVDIDELRGQLGLTRLEVINDFEALAYATQFVPAEDAFPVVDAAGSPGPALVVGPGTGLGCAALLPGPDGRCVLLPSEAGHVALAPGNEREGEVLDWLAWNRAYVHTGCVLSGPGLLNLYHALAGISARPAIAGLEPAQISSAALRGEDSLARETLAMFCAMLGSFVGDLAITFKASAGVYLAGGFLPSIRDFLIDSDFRKRFLNKGLMRPFLAGVPVKLIEHGRLGVIGAAALVDAGDRDGDPSPCPDAA